MTNEQMMYCVLKEHRLTEKEQLIMMAELKDEQFAEEKQQLIQKACDWLNSQACLGWIEDVKADEFVEQFKKAMEE